MIFPLVKSKKKGIQPSVKAVKIAGLLNPIQGITKNPNKNKLKIPPIVDIAYTLPVVMPELTFFGDRDRISKAGTMPNRINGGAIAIKLIRITADIGLTAAILRVSAFKNNGMSKINTEAHKIIQ